MTALYLEALVAIAASLSVLMAGAWVVQQRTGNSGWVDTDLDLFARPGRRWKRLVAGRGAPPKRPAMAGGGVGRDLVAAARGSHRDPQRRDIGRSPLCGLRQGMGADLAAEDVHLSPESGARIDPAGIRASLSPPACPATGCGWRTIWAR